MTPALDERKGEMDNADAYEVLDACATMYDRQAYALRAEGYEQAAVTIYRKSTLLRSLRTCIGELERRVEAAEAELGRLETLNSDITKHYAGAVRDARRYRFIRAQETPSAELCLYYTPSGMDYGYEFRSGEALDAAIDTAMQEPIRE